MPANHNRVMHQSNVLIILGMHRSGTSVAAQWMAESGLCIGDVLLGKTYNNKFGHFEDKDFLELHREVLAEHGKSYDVIEPFQLSMSDYHLKKSKMLVKLKSNLYTDWGWKEPRTVLFADHWLSLIPHAKVFAVYRHFRQVVDSLLRREESTFSRRKNLYLKWQSYLRFNKTLNERGNHFLRVWLHYNSILLEVLQNQKSPNHILINQERIGECEHLIMETVIQKWKFKLDNKQYGEVFREVHYSNNVKFNINYEESLLVKANDMYKKLEQFQSF